MAKNPQEEVIYPKIDEIIPVEHRARFYELLPRVIADAESRYSPARLSATPWRPKAEELGVAVLNPKDFNIDTFRREYTATGWQDGPISGFTTSKSAFILIGGYENREAVPKSIKTQWRIGPARVPPDDLEDLVKRPDHRLGMEPISIGPETLIDLYVNIEAAGYDQVRPVGLVIGTQGYIVSRTWK